MVKPRVRYLLVPLIGAFMLEAQAVCLDPKDPSKYYYPSVKAETESSVAIVVGTVASTKGLHGDRSDPEGWSAFRYTVNVAKYLKGRTPKSIVLTTPNDSGGYRMEVGETHLLFLSKRDRYYRADPCGNSSVLSKGDKVIAEVARLMQKQ